MTESQIEFAARKLCELRGINPDEIVGHEAEPDANGFVLAVLCHSPAWTLVRKEIIVHQQISDAIAFAKTLEGK